MLNALGRSASFLALIPLAVYLSTGVVDAQNRFHEDGELEALGASLGAYREARAADEGLAEAESEVAMSLKALAGEGRAGEPLSRFADLGRALWMSHGYARQKVRKGKVTSEVLQQASFGAGGLELAYRIPKDYDPKRAAYPLILTIPDADEPPAQHLRTHWILGELLERAILVCPAMPADPAEWDQVMVNGRPGGLCNVLAALRFGAEQFALDFERVYVVGRGKGVPAALATGNYAPQRFAGIVGRVGDAGELAPDNFTNLPIYFAAGGPQAKAFRHALLATVAEEHCRIEEADDEAALWSWMQAHPRRAFPESVTVVPGDPFPTRSYWLRIAPSSPNARATAELERELNRIRISTAGVSRVTLYLNDALVDLDRPLRLLCNGVEETCEAPRRLTTTLDLLYDETSDAGCVYVAEATIDTATDTAGAATNLGSAAETDATFDQRLAAAGDEEAALWELYLWCESSARSAQGVRVLRRLSRLAPDHEGARAALGFRGTPGLWFTSQEALARFQHSQQEDIAQAKGLVQDGSLWIHRDERAFATKGWVKDPPTGQWLSKGDVRRLAEGWVRQDLDWIPPTDAGRVDDGLWLVDGEWVDLATADRRHARIDSMWRIPRREVLLHSSADREVSLRALEHMARAIEDLRKVFGAEPVLPLEVAVLRDEEQYDRFAFGDPDGRRSATDAARMHVVHSAFFAESWFPRVGGKLEFNGMGVCYWDALAPNGDLFGVHAARLAVGLSYVEALDPSPKAVRKALSAGPKSDYYAAYQAEKLLPAWLRYGGAVYAERYFFDPTVAEGADPWWARNWSRDNLKGRGGLRSLQDVLAFRIEPDDREDGLKLLLEAGLLVAFLVDGGCAPVQTAHEEFKRVLAAGRLQESHVDALVAALVANEAVLRSW